MTSRDFSHLSGLPRLPVAEGQRGEADGLDGVPGALPPQVGRGRDHLQRRLQLLLDVGLRQPAAHEDRLRRADVLGADGARVPLARASLLRRPQARQVAAAGCPAARARQPVLPRQRGVASARQVGREAVDAVPQEVRVEVEREVLGYNSIDI